MTMQAAAQGEMSVANQDTAIRAVVARESGRLLGFIRRQVPEPGDAEDILQDVFFELVEASRMLQPIEQVGAWLFRVARNKIIDRFRRRKFIGEATRTVETVEADDEAELEDLLPARDAGPEARYARRVLLEEIDAALEELPAAQREVFLQHELEGKSYAELAQQTGASINTLLARKRYAVLHLRERLRTIRLEFDEQEG